MIKKIRDKILNLIFEFKAKKHPLSLRGKVELEDNELLLVESKLAPRTEVNNIVYSEFHYIEFNLIPKRILEVILENWTNIENALGAKGVLRSCQTYRNIHIPEMERGKEAYSNAWHRDTIGVTNVQMFILLHDTNRKNGPFRYIKSEDMQKVDKKYPDLKNPGNRSVNINIDEKYVSYFLGSRGDFLFVSTFNNYHSATIPELGFKRDMVSITFEPKNLTTWKNILRKEDIEQLIN